MLLTSCLQLKQGIALQFPAVSISLPTFNLPLLGPSPAAAPYNAPTPASFMPAAGGGSTFAPISGAPPSFAAAPGSLSGTLPGPVTATSGFSASSGNPWATIKEASPSTSAPPFGFSAMPPAADGASPSQPLFAASASIAALSSVPRYNPFAVPAAGRSFSSNPSAFDFGSTMPAAVGPASSVLPPSPFAQPMAATSLSFGASVNAPTAAAFSFGNLGTASTSPSPPNPFQPSTPIMAQPTSPFGGGSLAVNPQQCAVTGSSGSVFDRGLSSFLGTAPVQPSPAFGSALPFTGFSASAVAPAPASSSATQSDGYFFGSPPVFYPFRTSAPDFVSTGNSSSPCSMPTSGNGFSFPTPATASPRTFFGRLFPSKAPAPVSAVPAAGQPNVPASGGMFLAHSCQTCIRMRF